MASGLAADDTYNLYDKPLFAERGSNLYRPNKAADEVGSHPLAGCACTGVTTPCKRCPCKRCTVERELRWRACSGGRRRRGARRGRRRPHRALQAN